MKKHTRRVVSLLLALMMVLSMAACGTPTAKTTNKTDAVKNKIVADDVTATKQDKAKTDSKTEKSMLDRITDIISKAIAKDAQESITDTSDKTFDEQKLSDAYEKIMAKFDGENDAPKKSEAKAAKNKFGNALVAIEKDVESRTQDVADKIIAAINDIEAYA